MNPNESWIAEQARLLTLEDGFGPSSATKSRGPSGSSATVGEDAEAAASRSSSS
jgi:hypothetical protein